MGKKPMNKKVTLFLFTMLFIQPAGTVIAAEDENVTKAIAFLKTACVTSGSSLEMEAGADGVTVKNLLKGEVSGQIKITKNELEGFADAASRLGAEQADRMRECMKPYIDKILGALLMDTAVGNQQEYRIKTQGYAFHADDFDKLMRTLAEFPSEYLHINYLAQDSGLPEAKVIHYANLALENEFATHDGNGGFKITNKGISYVVSRGLI